MRSLLRIVESFGEAYDSLMLVTIARVENGRIEVAAESLSEGQEVRVVVLEEEPVSLSDAEKAWLRDTLKNARGESTRDFAELLEELDSID